MKIDAQRGLQLFICICTLLVLLLLLFVQFVLIVVSVNNGFVFQLLLPWLMYDMGTCNSTPHTKV